MSLALVLVGDIQPSSLKNSVSITPHAIYFLSMYVSSFTVAFSPLREGRSRMVLKNTGGFKGEWQGRGGAPIDLTNWCRMPFLMPF